MVSPRSRPTKLRQLNHSGMSVFRRVIASFAVVVAVLSLIGVAAPYTVDGHTVRDQLVVKLSGWAQGELRVAGDVRLKSLFDLTIEAEKVRIDAPARFSDFQAVQADQVAARLNVWQLLKGHIVFDKVWVTRPVFTMRRGWTQPPPERLWRAVLLDDRDAFTRLTQTMRTAPFEYIAFDDARLQTGSSAGSAAMREVPFSLTIRRQSAGERVRLAAQVGRDAELTEITIARSVFRPAGPTREAPLSVNMETADGAQLSFDGRIIRANGTRFIGSIDFRDAPLAALARWLDLPAGDALVDRRFSATAALEAAQQKISLQQLDVAFGRTRISGLLNLALGGNMPKLSGTLGMSGIDLRGFSLTGQADGVLRAEDPRSLRRGSSWPLARQFGAWLESFNADLRLSADSLTLDAFTTGETAAFLSVSEGIATLNVAELMVFGGMMNGQFSVRWRDQAFHLTGKGKAAGVDLQPLLTTAQVPQLFSGQADVSFAVTGKGSTLPAATRNTALSGRIIALEGGELALDVAGMASRARQRAIDGESAQAASRLIPERSGYDILRASFRVNSRELRLAPFEIVQNGWIIRGKGRVDLLKQRLNWRLKVARALTETAKAYMAGSAALPSAPDETIILHVTGPMHRPWISYKMPKLPLSNADGSQSWWR